MSARIETANPSIKPTSTGWPLMSAVMSHTVGKM